MADQNDFDAAIAAACESPSSEDAWEALEAFASNQDCPDEVFAVYRRVLDQDLPVDIGAAVGRRAMRFHQDWFGGEVSGLAQVLERVLEIDGAADWAFQRLTVVLTTAERWDELLAAYDRALVTTKDDGRRMQLLEEAGQVAKDVANIPSKAVVYFQQLHALKSDDLNLVATLERLLERQESWKELVALWSTQLDDPRRQDREQLLARIAQTWVEKLDSPSEALPYLKLLLTESEDDAEACRLLESILATEGANEAVRQDALKLVRSHYQATNQPAEIVRVLRASIARCGASPAQVLHDEAGRILTGLGDDKGAMEHYSALLCLEPGSVEAQEKLLATAERSGDYLGYATGIDSAASQCQEPARRVALLAELARVRVAFLNDVSGAIAAYTTALTEQGIESKGVCKICTELNELYIQTDQPDLRLGILKRLVGAETDEKKRNEIRAEAARLAAGQGDLDAAVAWWNEILAANPEHPEALSSVVVLLERSERWHPLIDALDRRATSASGGKRRDDLTRIAQLYQNRLDAKDDAIRAWQRVYDECGADAETVDALADLLSEAGRWEELTHLLERTARREAQQTADRLVRLADAQRLHLNNLLAAASRYGGALSIDASHEGARQGLTALLDEPDCRETAVDRLMACYQQSEEWDRFFSLAKPRLELASDSRQKLQILRDTANVKEKRVGDDVGAMECLIEAFALAPTDRALEAELVRLTQQTGNYTALAQAYDSAVATVSEEPHEMARLRFEHAEILERHLSDDENALEAYLFVATKQPSNLRAVQAVVRIGTQLARWRDVSRAVIACVRDRGAIEEVLFAAMEQSARETGALEDYSGSLSDAVKGEQLPNWIAFECHWRVANWCLRESGEKEKAVSSITLALTHDPTRVDALSALAELQRETGDSDLLATLCKLGDCDRANLDIAFETAKVAVETSQDASLIRESLTRLLARATASYRGTTPTTSEANPQECVIWAVDKLVALYCEDGKPASAIDLLIESARLPFEEEIRLRYKHKAAKLAADELGDMGTAVEMYRGILSLDQNDSIALESLTQLYESQERFAELLSLRRHELENCEISQDRLSLRLEVARLAGEIERRGGRLDVLLANLEDCPGHEATVDALSTLLQEKGAHEELVSILEKQASALETDGDTTRAAALWAHIASLAETPLDDIEKAIASHRKVVSLTPHQLRAHEAASLDALARLYVACGKPAQAVTWLEQGLNKVSAQDRGRVVLRLAEAYVGAADTTRAIACIENHLVDSNPDIRLRTLLATLHRDAENWEPLARLLTKTLVLLEEDDAKIAAAREAASIYNTRLNQPEKSIPALETALELVPDDRVLRLQFARGLRCAGLLGPAREQLVLLLQQFGRRRSVKRAQVHVELSLVAREEGNLEEAFEQAETAAQLDLANPQIQKMTADLALQNGKVDEAERRYRALLLVVRRQPAGRDESAVGISEVLYALYRITQTRGDSPEADELLQDSLDAAIASDTEIVRLQRTLEEYKDYELLLQALQDRLKVSKEPSSQARILSNIAQVLDQHLGKTSDALDAQLEAIALIPGDIALCEAARHFANRCNRVKDFVAQVYATVDQLRRDNDEQRTGELLLRAGIALEEDAEDLSGALEVYCRIERSGQCQSDAYHAIARVAGKLGDDEERIRALDALLALATANDGTGALRSAEQIDALYQIATVFVASEDRQDQGLELLSQAYHAEPRYCRTGEVLQAYLNRESSNQSAMILYEEVARGSADPLMLLDFLERRAHGENATPSEVKEAVDLANQLGQQGRGEALLSRAVEAARASDEGLSSAVWAVRGLAEQRARSGDWPSAKQLFLDVSDLAGPELVSELGLLLAAEASQSVDSYELAAEMYEFLRDRDPANRLIWEPLVDLYRDMGATDRLEAVISATLPTLVDLDARNAMRLQYANYLLDRVDDQTGSCQVLRDILLDDPDHLQAAALLEQILRETGDEQGLADFFWQRFEEAKERRNPDTISDIAKRLGALLTRLGSEDAITVYRTAVEISPDDPDLLRSTLGLLDPENHGQERADLLEKLIRHVDGEEARLIALELSSLRDDLGDSEGARRAIELGFKVAPDDDVLRQRLQSWYRENQLWGPLAEMIRAEAERQVDPEVSVSLYREAAAIYRSQLSDPDTTSKVLGDALQIRPNDASLVGEIVSSLVESERRQDAVEIISGAMNEDVEREDQVELLLLRSSVRGQMGLDRESAADLEHAFEIDPDAVRPQLLATLEQQRVVAQQTCDRNWQRDTTLRMVRLLEQSNEIERAEELLTEWCELEPKDREALLMVRQMNERVENWDGVLTACARLVVIEDGESQIENALMLAQASQHAQRPEAARHGLEVAHAAQPDSVVIRDKLRQIYELSGAHRELAGLLLSDGDHGVDDDERYDAYCKAALLFLNALEDPHAALVPAEKAHLLRPTDHDAVLLRVDTLSAAGLLDDAMEILEPAIGQHKRRSPELAALQLRMARTAAAKGDQETQLTWLKKSFDVDRKNGQVAAELAELATEMGQYDLALKPLRAITLMDDPGPITRVMALLWEAKIEHARGNRAKAELWAKKALREDPGFGEAQDFLSEIAT